MKIEIKNKGPRSYYNEISYIKLNFSKVLSNPGKPAKDVIYGAIFIALVVAEVGIILSLIGGIKKMNSLMAEDGPKVIEVDEEGIRCTENGSTNDLNWDDILCIALNKHSIAVLPKETSMYGIYCSLEYKDELFKAIKEAGHFYMIEDNVNVSE